MLVLALSARYRTAVDGELSQDLGRPLAELGGPDWFDPVTHRDDGVKVIEIRVIVFTIGGSYSEFPNNWILIQPAY